MQIRELHIDGFGIFHNALIKEFRPGINVIFGPNEYGKTTLLEFIRKVNFNATNLSLLLSAIPFGLYLYLKDKYKYIARR